MKNQLLTAVLFALSVLPISCGNGGHIQQYYQPHVGVWEDADFTGSKAIVVLRENGTGTILFDRQLSDFKYVMDYSKKPRFSHVEVGFANHPPDHAMAGKIL